MLAGLGTSRTDDTESTSKTSKISKDSFDPHTTKWSDVNLLKFAALVSVSSTIENVAFYPYVFIFIYI